MANQQYLKVEPSSMANRLNIVDLFCGCGGLSCGFDYYGGELNFRTVLGIDNYPAAVKIFNANFPTQAGAKLSVGRLTDMTWFSHTSEIRLYYLVHFAFSQGDSELISALFEMGLEQFLRQLKAADERFADKATKLGNAPDYRDALSLVPGETFSLALPKTILENLAISSLSKPVPDTQHLPWCEEYTSLLPGGSCPNVVLMESDLDLARDSDALLAQRLSQLREASSKTGSGQNRNNAARLKAMVEFCDGRSSADLWRYWTEWFAERATIRAHFCLNNQDAIDAMYSGSRRAHVILGGPPCKGFSRIGRPVIQALRDQGVHAWSHKDFGDERNALMCQYVLFLEALTPDLFLFENVSNFQSVLKTPNGELDAPAMLEELIGDISDGHVRFHIHHTLVNSRNFAVPQDRRRFIMVGINAHKGPLDACLQFFAFDEVTEDVNLKYALLGLSEPAVFRSADGVKSDYRCPTFQVYDDLLPPSVRKYLAWTQQPDPWDGSKVTFTTAHIYRECRPDDQAFIEFVAPGIRWMDLKTPRSVTLSELRAFMNAVRREGSPALRQMADEMLKKADDSLMLRLLLEHTQEMHNLPEQHLLLDSYLKNGGSTHGDWLERLSPNKPCKTIVAHIGKDTYGYWHPTEPRALSIREAARVQSFPDFFRFDCCGVVDTYAAIGNAVPPLLSVSFARRIQEVNRRWNIFSDQGRRENIADESRMRATQLVFAMPD